MQLVYRSSVNRWECDENDHLNVRFYVAKHVETLRAGLNLAGYQVDEGVSVQMQHLRFLQESRLAAPISGYVAILPEASGLAMFGPGDRGFVLTELRHSLTEEVLCTCVHRVDKALVAESPLPQMPILPDHASPRGVVGTALPVPDTNPADLLHKGFSLIGAGIIGAGEVDRFDRLNMHHYMGRLSDSMPHLWAKLFAGEESSGAIEEGGAVLEYQLQYHSPLNLGDRFAVYSGLSQTGTKVQQFMHLIYNENNACVATSAHACGVRMNLQTRKAITLPEARLQRMRALELKVLK